MKIEKQILTLKPELDTLIEKYEESINVLMEKIQLMTEVASQFDHNWIGAWASDSFNYYNDFISGSNGTLILDEEQLKDYIEKECNFTIKQIEDAIPEISKSHRDFRERIITELSVIKGRESHEPEIALLEQIENHKWGMSPHDYVKMKMPKTVFTYNPETLLNKGLDYPPHISMGGTILSLFSILASIKDFQRNCRRLLRQLELKYSVEEFSPSKTDFILRVLNSFHTVAIQLRNRHQKRETLIIEDEYDVQDLLHGLLKIEFDDVRPEEHTPSYAGSATRMDFLLNKEKIVIEAKKTRVGLKDKEVGDQLILDAQHYKSHPNCKRLICFVYDPENRIRNPRGLESDLCRLSDEDMVVEVYIRP